MGLPDIHDIDKRLSSHEAVCAERYGAFRERVGRIEALGWSTLAAMLTTGIRGLPRKVQGPRVRPAFP
jgi:hypothetical protein